MARVSCVGQRPCDFVLRGPDVAQIDRLPLLVGAERIVRQIDGNAARKRKRDDQRRARKKCRPERRMDACFEVSISREHRARHHVLLVHRTFERRVDRA
jgi:hypothetical protein